MELDAALSLDAEIRSEDNLNDMPMDGEEGEEKPMSEQERLNKEFETEVLNKAIRPKKGRRAPRSSRNGDDTGGEDLGGAATKEERELLAAMTQRAMQAAARDRRAVETQQPALHKLELLGEFCAVLQRRVVQQGEFEPSLLEAVRTWLEPLQDTLPNARIRTELLQTLAKMDLDQDMLMMTGVGRPVLLLSRHPGESMDNRRLALSRPAECPHLCAEATKSTAQRSTPANLKSQRIWLKEWRRSCREWSSQPGWSPFQEEERRNSSC